MNNSQMHQKPMLGNVQVVLISVLIIFTGFANVAHAQLSESECDAKNSTLAKQADQASKAGDSINAAYSKYYKSLIELYEGPCSHLSSSSSFIKYSREMLPKYYCDEFDCPVETKATNTQQPNIQTQTTQSPTTTDELADDPQVFGGGASPSPTKNKKRKK